MFSHDTRYLRYGMWTLLTALTAVSATPCRAQEDDPSIYKTEFRVINVHQHCNSPNTKAITAELEVMDRVGVDVVTILDGRWTGSNLLDWIELRKEFSHRVVLFANIEFALAKKSGFSEAIVRELDVQHRLGVQGIKGPRKGVRYLNGSLGNERNNGRPAQPLLHPNDI